MISQAFDEIHRLILAIAFFGLLITVILYLFDMTRNGTLNGPREENDDVFTDHSSDPYQTTINPGLNTSMSNHSEAGNSSFFKVYRNSSFF
jgi:hypothetical protein